MQRKRAKREDESKSKRRNGEIERNSSHDLGRPASLLRQYAIQTLPFELNAVRHQADDVTGLAGLPTGVAPAGLPRPRLVCRGVDP